MTTIPDTELVLVVAADENNVIGLDGGVPWHYPEDVRQYKHRIAGHPVILGRRTFDSMDPLTDCYTVVLTSDDSRSAESETVEYATNPRIAVDAAARAGATEAVAGDGTGANDSPPVTYVIGGEAVYDLFLPFAGRVFLSRIHERNEGDRYFPDLGAEWTELSRESYEGFDVIEYEQASPRPLDDL
ncbi:dihydrofolate reductase [Haloarcula sp. CBA1130]|uniref:dihydrofolate reductase n=1 Tax=unclassified Haloarcula TaxID=2624677 RepID=UPI001244BBF2|nr:MULTISPECIES: dihydrofolate reductase [unclassified Haloarcula]KAA9397372.1 dihydrofolate reductase [Haloarcula sp. CBA1129]KAA9402594.1 dihydrofolate reductase [Haloarcula sp. CBA1130]